MRREGSEPNGCSIGLIPMMPRCETIGETYEDKEKSNGERGTRTE